MTPDQIRQIVEHALRDWHNFPWLAWVITFFISAIAVVFGTYLVERAKNRAYMKTLDEVTKIAARAQAAFDAQLEDHKFKNQILLAALDKRLAAHQTAYALWRKLLSTAARPQVGADAAFKCQEWWNHNCLYLSREVREAFRQACEGVFILAGKRTPETESEARTAHLENALRRVKQAGEVILASVSLPAMDGETKSDFEMTDQKG